jgi:hypothetical protein
MSSALKMARARKAICVLGVFVGVLLFSVALFSQGSSGRLLGAVTDQTGGVVSGATVTIVDKDRGVARTLTTDDAGEYNAPNLIPATYIIRVEANGFKRLERQNVVLEVNKEVRVDLTVQPGEQTQSVTVTEAIPLVETSNATLGGTLSNDQLIDIPLNGRNYQNLLSLRPGVMTQPGGSPWTQSTNGSRPDETAWMLEGVINVTFWDAKPLQGNPSPFTDGATIVPIDAIQEFNMMENPKAEYGWKPGAVVNVGIKSGTNNLHGTAYAFGRSDALDARNVFNPSVDPTGTCTLDGLNPDTNHVCDKSKAQLEQFGATVGGPIKKDKLFFFTAYEGLRSSIGNIFIEPLPSTTLMQQAITNLQNAPGFAGLCPSTNAAGSLPGGKSVNCLSPVSLALTGCTGNPAVAGSYTCLGGGGPSGPSTNGLWGMQHAGVNSLTYASNFANRNTSDNGVAKLDYRINDKHSITGSVLIGNYTSQGEDHPVVNSNWRDDVPIRSQTYTADWIWTPKSNWVNDLRAAYDRYDFRILPSDRNLLANGTDYPLNTGITSFGGFPTVYLGGGSGYGVAGGFWFGSWRGRPLESSPSPYFDFQDSISYLRGKHAFKFGGEFAHITVNQFIHDTRGRFDFGGGPGAGGKSALRNFYAGNLKDIQLLVGNPNLQEHWTSTAGFIQDDWRTTQKLTVNLGLRYSYVSPFKEANNQIANFDPNSPTGLVQQGQPGVGSLIKPDYKDFSPRLGFAWDVSGNGTTVVRGGASIIYSSWQMAMWFANPGPAGGHNHSASLAANPTGVVCGAPSPCAADGTFGGNIQAATFVIQPSKVPITWDGTAVPSFRAGCGPGTTLGGGCDLLAVDPNLKYPYMSTWSLGVTHAFNSNLSLEVGYVGDHGTRLTGVRDLNQNIVVNGVTVTDASGSGFQPYANKFPAFRYINYVSNQAHSNYNGLQATLTQRVTHGLSFTSGYTYSHSLDNGSLGRFGALPQNSYNALAEYGSSDLDVRHHWTFTASYDLPGRKGFAQMLEGWKINTVVTLQSGMPWGGVDTGNNFANTGPAGGEEVDRWDFFGNPNDFKSGSSSLPYCNGPGGAGSGCYVSSGISGLVSCAAGSDPSAGPGASCTSINPALPAASSMWNQCTSKAADPAGTLLGGGCFVAGSSVLTPPAMNHFGNAGRNIFRDSGFKDWDFSLFKNFRFTERFAAQFRFEVFNLLNTPIIANPYGAAAGANLGNDPSAPTTFGCGCQTPDVGNGNALVGSGDARVMQLGLKLSF